MVRMCPSILTVDRASLVEEIRRIEGAADLLHLDVMDGTFVPATTFSLDESASIISSTSLPVDAHLMVANSDSLGPSYAEIGASSVTIHVESTQDIQSTLRAIKSKGARASIAIKPTTAIDDYQDYLSEVDMVLIMTVEPGAGGQPFIEAMLEKVRRTRAMIGSRDIWLQVDGGINLSTIERAAEAGADTFVAGSAVFTSDDPIAAIRSLRRSALSQFKAN